MKRSILLIALTGLLFSCSSNKKISNVSELGQTTTKKVVVTSYGPKGKIIKSVVTRETPIREIAVEEKTKSEEVIRINDDKKKEGLSVEDANIYAALDIIDRQEPLNDQFVGLNSNNTYDSWMRFIKEKSSVYKNLSKIKEHSIAKNGTGDRGKSWASIAGFSVSIVGLFIFGIIFGIVAIVFGAIGLKSDLRGLAIAALVIGIVDVIAAIIIAAVDIFFLTF